MVKKLLTTVLCLMAVMVVHADEKSDAMLARVAAVLSDYGNYEVVFSVSVNDLGDTRGKYYVSVDRFSITVGGQTHFSDGELHYEINDEDKEVVVDKLDPASYSIFSNPARAFEFAAENYEGFYKGEELLVGEKCDVTTLVPLSRTYNMSVTLYVSVESGLPMALIYRYENDVVDIIIEKITPLESVDESLFRFDKSAYPGYEVIDFR